jgi:hypothetical protein
MKRDDGTARFVGGDHDQVLARIADFYMERSDALTAAGAKRGITVSALTNADTADISQAIRTRMKARGELGADETVYEAIDQREEQYALPIATGDKLRLFRRTWAKIDGKGGSIGNNGDIVEVVGRMANGLILRDKAGRVGEVEDGSALQGRSPPSPHGRSFPWRPPRTGCSLSARHHSNIILHRCPSMQLGADPFGPRSTHHHSGVSHLLAYRQADGPLRHLGACLCNRQVSLVRADGFGSGLPRAYAPAASFAMLWAVQSIAHSLDTFSMPRRRSWRKPLACLMCPKTGSTTCLRSR